jgi:hypothetical protein
MSYSGPWEATCTAVCLQADWLAGLLIHEPTSGAGFPRCSDLNNMLKLGYDVGSLRYPTWFEGLGSEAGAKLSSILPATVRQEDRPHA